MNDVNVLMSSINVRGCGREENVHTSTRKLWGVIKTVESSQN